MKKLFALFAVFAAFAASAADSVPMVDVTVRPANMEIITRTDVSMDAQDTILRAYVTALKAAAQERGQLTVLPNQRATVVITEFYDPADALTKVKNDLDAEANIGGVGRNSPFGNSRSPSRAYGAPERAKIAGYVEFDGKRISFEESAMAGMSMTSLADSVGKGVFQRLLAL